MSVQERTNTHTDAYLIRGSARITSMSLTEGGTPEGEGGREGGMGRGREREREGMAYMSVRDI